MSWLPENVQVIGLIKSIGPKHQVNHHLFDDQSKISCIEHCDTIILATGYHYDISFLDQQTIPHIDYKLGDSCVIPLYEHIFYIYNPTLMFIGLNGLIVPFPFFHVQVQLCVELMLRNFKHDTWPSLSSMMEHVNQQRKDFLDNYCENDNTNALLPWHHFHTMRDKQWSYEKRLAQWTRQLQMMSNTEGDVMLHDTVKASAPNQIIEDLYNHVWHRRRTNLPIYKNENYKMILDDKCPNEPSQFIILKSYNKTND